MSEANKNVAVMMKGEKATIMKITQKKISTLIPYKDNPRDNLKAIESVANSIREFGFKQPLVIDSNNVIIAGHTRYEAALKLGLESVPCVICSSWLKAIRPKTICRIWSGTC